MTDQLESKQDGSPLMGSGKVVAIVSGKGGSGKTMFAVAVAQGVAITGKEVLLFDADFATGGLTYYLTFREFQNARIGLSDIIDNPSEIFSLKEWATRGNSEDPLKEWLSHVRLVSIGDQRRIRDDMDKDFTSIINETLNESRAIADLVVVDCRGGIDKQSLAICSMADEIIIVAETDATSIRTSQHLTEVLSSAKLRSKILGYVLNKVMDDPTSIAKTVSSLLGIKYLGSIPFDIEATRAYIQGRIPDDSTLFARQVFAMISQISSDVNMFQKIRKLDPEEFGTVTLKSPDIRTGGLAIIALSLYMSFGYIVFSQSKIFPFARFGDFDIVIIVIANAVVFGALSDPIKQSIGRIFQRYIDTVNRSIRPRRRKNWL